MSMTEFTDELHNTLRVFSLLRNSLTDFFFSVRGRNTKFAVDSVKSCSYTVIMSQLVFLMPQNITKR